MDQLVDRARALASTGPRRLLGITGAPAAGKSTLAGLLVTALDGIAELVPMDGFHLAEAELHRLDRHARKGAPDTFDGAGFVALLRRLRTGTETVYAPEFRRELEEPVAGAIPVPPSVPLVVVEGNYLLLPDQPWGEVRDLLDEVWFLDLDEAERLHRLTERHIAFGREPLAAAARARGTDQRNADLIAGTIDRADLVVRMAPSNPA
ncbi:nucleoside/nucleotide kinase family protein [Plantactinospora mayteni]|uniref:nucleoside/nucleotide kinase family protein n=1 Tax=Plantactinospora mayteni TaxID=566021 RepID=UPI0019454A7A|nr:nucleoside/nucleotide kinase family protein [Plantactinospora mayteni]